MWSTQVQSLSLGGIYSSLKTSHRNEPVINFDWQLWKVLKPMPVGRDWFGCAPLPNNPDKILIAGPHSPEDQR